MKTIKTRKNGTKRISLDFSRPKLTDQSGAKSSDINNIMLQYSKTGVLPVVQEKVAKYIDNTLAIPLEQAYEQLNHAKELFMGLPARIRKLMDNDPTKLESFLSDPANRELLEKEKVLKKKVEPIAKQKVDPPAVASKQEDSK